jgi:hypothetical protein
VYENRLKHLEEAHHALDKQITGLESTGRFDDAQMQELKKQKLHLRDQIEQLQRKHQDG